MLATYSIRLLFEKCIMQAHNFSPERFIVLRLCAEDAFLHLKQQLGPDTNTQHSCMHANNQHGECMHPLLELSPMLLNKPGYKCLS